MYQETGILPGFAVPAHPGASYSASFFTCTENQQGTSEESSQG